MPRYRYTLDIDSEDNPLDTLNWLAYALRLGWGAKEAAILDHRPFPSCEIFYDEANPLTPPRGANMEVKRD